MLYVVAECCFQNEYIHRKFCPYLDQHSALIPGLEKITVMLVFRLIYDPTTIPLPEPGGIFVRELANLHVGCVAVLSSLS